MAFSNTTEYSGIPLPGSATGGNTYSAYQDAIFNNDGLGSLISEGQMFGAPQVPGKQAFDQGILNQALGQVGTLQGAGQQALGAANQGAAGLNALGGQLASLGGQVAGQFGQNQQFANQALQDAFDPMQAQYKANLAQLTDATNANLANAGLASSPYGASITAGAQGNFQNNWQTAQIQREQMGAQTATGLQNQQLNAQSVGGGLITAGGQLDSSALQSILQGSGLDVQAQGQAASIMAQIFGNLSETDKSSISVSN